jgi:O-antigen/teichoic acid export membrane protein
MGKSIVFKKVSFGFLVSSLSIAIDGLAGLIILPLLLKYFSDEIAGLWIFFLSFTGLIMLGQAGLAPVIVRISASIKVNKEFPKGNFWGIVFFSYLLSAFFVFLICFTLYFLYIKNVLLEQNFLFQGTLCWLFLTLSFMLRIFNVRYLHILNGLGEVGWDKVIQIFVALLNLAGFYMVLKFEMGFSFLGVVYLVSGLVFSFLSFIVFKLFNHDLISSNSLKTNYKDVISLFKDSGKILILNITSFIVLQANMFVVERYAGLKVLPYYNGLYRITALLLAIGGVVASMLYPFIAQKFSCKDYFGVIELFKKNILISDLLVFFISLILLGSASTFIPLWLGKNGYLGNSIFGIMLLLTFLYTNHNAFANTIIATGANTFIIPAVINALLSIIFSIIGGYYFGILGVVSGSLVAIIFPSAYVIIWSLKYLRGLTL